LTKSSFDRSTSNGQKGKTTGAMVEEQKFKEFAKEFPAAPRLLLPLLPSLLHAWWASKRHPNRPNNQPL